MTTSTRTTTVMAEPLVQHELKLVEQTGTEAQPTQGAVSPEALKKLLAWLSPAFPVGGFSYSHGLEWAIEDGTVRIAADLEGWVAAILRHGAGRSDGILLAHAHCAATAGNAALLDEVNALAIAFQPTKERHLEATAQGRAFLTTVAATWPNDRLSFVADHFKDAPVAYAVAVGIAAGCHDVPLAATLTPSSAASPPISSPPPSAPCPSARPRASASSPTSRRSSRRSHRAPHPRRSTISAAPPGAPTSLR
jgi:urease accessory protein